MQRREMNTEGLGPALLFTGNVQLDVTPLRINAVLLGTGQNEGELQVATPARVAWEYADALPDNEEVAAAPACWVVTKTKSSGTPPLNEPVTLHV